MQTKFTSLPTKNTAKASQQTDLFESLRAFLLEPIRKGIRGKKLRTLASKTIRIQKTPGKIVIDNNQKPTEVIFYYQLSKLHQSEAKSLKFYKLCKGFDIISLLRRNR